MTTTQSECDLNKICEYCLGLGEIEQYSEPLNIHNGPEFLGYLSCTHCGGIGQLLPSKQKKLAVLTRKSIDPNEVMDRVLKVLEKKS